MLILSQICSTVSLRGAMLVLHSGSNPSSSDCRGSRKNRRSAFCDIL